MYNLSSHYYELLIYEFLYTVKLIKDTFIFIDFNNSNYMSISYKVYMY